MPGTPEEEGNEVDGEERGLEVSGEERFVVMAFCVQILTPNTNGRL